MTMYVHDARIRSSHKQRKKKKKEKKERKKRKKKDTWCSGTKALLGRKACGVASWLRSKRDLRAAKYL